MFKIRYTYYPLEFIRPAGTSRGVLKIKKSWFIFLSKIQNPVIEGIGEVSIIDDLSIDDVPNLEDKIGEICSLINESGKIPDLNELNQFPSIQFALETALIDLENGGEKILFESNFTKGISPIPINGLIWMGEKSYMLEQIEEKLNENCRCIKIKIGAIDFESELEILKFLRKNYDAKQLEIRVDANGAFDEKNVLMVLEELKKLEIHSIEQPIKPKNWDLMKNLCEQNIVPIALDEELIGINTYEEKLKLLEFIQPQYIILKPSLLGGLKKADEWIEIAEKLNIAWWATSALESNIGLNAISQWVANKIYYLPQGLGTGKLYSNNIESPLISKASFLYFQADKKWGI
jgi:o-succinylbenzoate synthase